MNPTTPARTVPAVKAGLIISIAVFIFYTCMYLIGDPYRYKVAGALYELFFLPALVLLLCMPLVSGWFVIRKRGTDRRLAALTLAISFFSIAIFLMLIQRHGGHQ
ncbi:hypothetical protein [Flaviaesturariibacter amylovorans]|uniref:DUF1634 domain-containing protein n=1 Tax=Flaviaesturariibacter amylovorans TaxID=1084520 RepID=A0ABP8GN76_9BACT